MKRILFIVLAVALMLSLCAGCNTGKRIIVDDDFDDDIGPIVIGGNTDDEPHVDIPDGWPPNLPPYPDGEIVKLELDDEGRYYITIINTSIAMVEKYGETMINAGWESIGTDDHFSSLAMWFNKGDREASVILADDAETLTIRVYRSSEKEDLPNVWPAGHLPQGFPEYPEGEITRVYIADDRMLFITVEGTSRGAYEKYITTLEDAGWSVENDGEMTFEDGGVEYTFVSWSIKKDGVSGVVTFDGLFNSVEIVMT